MGEEGRGNTGPMEAHVRKPEGPDGDAPERLPRCDRYINVDTIDGGDLQGLPVL